MRERNGDVWPHFFEGNGWVGVGSFIYTYGVFVHCPLFTVLFT
jgi:hypothetical protein